MKRCAPERRGGRAPVKRERERVGAEFGERGFAAGAVDQADIHTVAFAAAQDVEDVFGPRIGAGQGGGEFGGFEKNKVHGGKK